MDDIVFTELLPTPEKEPLAPISEQVSHLDGKGRYALTLIAKRTYHILHNGNCVLADLQEPLVNEFQFYSEHEQLLQEDMDLYPMKPYTDVVVKGSAYAPQGADTFIASVQVGGKKSLEFVISGDRKIFRNHHGMLQFSDPDPIDSVPLRYDFAYGGVDRIAEEAYELPEEYLKHLPPDTDPYAASPYRYLRNPAGKGFLIQAEERAMEACQLPNIEDPSHRLTPETMALLDPDKWMKMPLPRGTDWVHPLWFPRSTYFGMYIYPTEKALQLQEVAKGWADPSIVQARHLSERVSYRAGNGASLGLQMVDMKGDEAITLQHMKADRPEWTLRLPNDVPRLWIDGRNGELIEVVPQLYSVKISPDDNTLVLLWGGTGPAIRPYFDYETAKMPHKVEWKMN